MKWAIETADFRSIKVNYFSDQPLVDDKRLLV